MPSHDVAILTDFRYPGGTSASVAEEVYAQAAAGLSTVLVQVPSPFLKAERGFNPRILDCLRDGRADLAVRGDAVSARVLVIRQPRVFAADLKNVPSVQADRVVMVVNQGPQDLAGGPVYYDLNEVRQRVEGYFGPAVAWTTIGPLVRQQVLSATPEFPLSTSDWHNIIDVDQWRAGRTRPVGPVPVIGRHGRPDPVKWPRTAEEISQAYPLTDDFRVRVLGGGELAAERLGRLPESWDVLPFGAIHPRDFLRSIDFFVYFHDPSWVEAFGRTVLEAMASGAPAIVPASFKLLFEDAALYATPDQVQDLVRDLHGDWDRYLDVSRRAQSFVDERFGYQSHIARLRELGVAVAAEPDHREHRFPVVIPRQVRRVEPAARVLMLSSNGAGLGHLTRLMSIARRLPDDLQTVIATQSHAASIVQQSGYLTEYIPSRTYLGIAADRWNEYLYRRIVDLLAVHRPRVVAVDGTVPYSGLLRALAEHPEITWVWVRRAMWKQDQGQRWIERGRAFDLILEPGEFAAPADVGPTVVERDNARCVGPITYLDPDELLDPGAARAELGLDERPAVLVQLGAGNINDIASPVARIGRYLDEHGFQIVLAESPIATRPIPAPAGARVAKVYPLSRYLKGFDLAVSAAGYNSFHELIAFGVPSVFVPNEETALDDQAARARYANEVGAGLTIFDPSGDEVEEVLSRAVRPEVRAELTAACAALAIPNGAADAAAWLGGLCLDRQVVA